MVAKMRLVTGRVYLAATLLSSVFFNPMCPPKPHKSSTDPVVGSWKLDIEKSTNPTAESELITITRQGKLFQITFQAMQSNKYNPHYQVMTDMKGTTSKLVQADG